MKELRPVVDKNGVQTRRWMNTLPKASERVRELSGGFDAAARRAALAHVHANMIGWDADNNKVDKVMLTPKEAKVFENYINTGNVEGVEKLSSNAAELFDALQFATNGLPRDAVATGFSIHPIDDYDHDSYIIGNKEQSRPSGIGAIFRTRDGVLQLSCNNGVVSSRTAYSMVEEGITPAKIDAMRTFSSFFARVTEGYSDDVVKEAIEKSGGVITKMSTLISDELDSKLDEIYAFAEGKELSDAQTLGLIFDAQANATENYDRPFDSLVGAYGDLDAKGVDEVLKRHGEEALR